VGLLSERLAITMAPLNIFACRDRGSDRPLPLQRLAEIYGRQQKLAGGHALMELFVAPNDVART